MIEDGWSNSLIQNCLEQSYPHIEIVVVDDGSSDDTAARLASFGNRIRVISQPNSGVSAARNTAVLAATGDFVQFLDSDNLLHPEHVEAKVRAFAAMPDADLCYCSPTDVSLFGVKPLLRQPSANTVRDEDSSPTVDLLDHIAAVNYPFLVSSVTMPRHACLRFGSFDVDLRRGSDARYWFRLALAKPKVICLARRLFYRCRLADGLGATFSQDKSTSYKVCMRNVVDLLRRPEHWPMAAEYLTDDKQWVRLFHSDGSVYGHDFATLLQTIADLPDAGQGSNRSPLPVLIYLWMLGERARPSGRRAAGSEALADVVMAAMAKAPPIGPADRIDWINRGAKAAREAEVRGDAIGRGGTASIRRAPGQDRRRS